MLHNPYSNHYQQIDNPPNPYKGPIPNGLVPGKQIFISGTYHGDQFRVNFVTSSGAIALHINPRSSQNAIVRNSHIGGRWGAEERSGNMPFQRNAAFEMIILVENDKFRIAVNGNHHSDFNHRVPYQEVTEIDIGGDGRVNRLVFSGGASNPSEIISPPTPFAIPITNGPNPGRLIQISGHVPHNSQFFAINLQNGPDQNPSDIAFHFNPRFNDGAPYLVKNNCRHGGWGSEEREHSLPFGPGSNFDMLILIDPSEFKVAVNGQHYTQMRHRNGLHDANTLSIKGDITIRAIRQY